MCLASYFFENFKSKILPCRRLQFLFSEIRLSLANFSLSISFVLKKFRFVVLCLLALGRGINCELLLIGRKLPSKTIRFFWAASSERALDDAAPQRPRATRLFSDHLPEPGLRNISRFSSFSPKNYVYLYSIEIPDFDLSIFTEFLRQIKHIY